MTRALIVDDHPAVRNGLVSALRSAPELVPLATAGGLSDALAEAERRKPDVALVDYRLSDGDGLLLCHRLKQLTTPPAVVIYSAFARPQMALGAAVAGADGLVDKEAPLDVLFDAIRTVARGGKALPPLRPQTVERIVVRLEPEDLPIIGMRIDNVPFPEIAAVLRVDERELARRVKALLSRLAGPTAVRPRQATPRGR